MLLCQRHQLVLVLASHSPSPAVLVLVPFLARHLQVPARLKPSRRLPCSLVCATSSRHHSSCQPRVMHVELDTSRTIPRLRPYVSLDILAVYGHMHSLSVCFRLSFFILDPSLPSLAPFPFALAIEPQFSPLLSTSHLLSRFDISYIHCLLSGHRTPFAYDAARSVAGGAHSLWTWTSLSPFPFLSR